MAEIITNLSVYNLKLQRQDNKQIKPSDYFAGTLSKDPAHIYVMCDHTFASLGYDIGETDKFYKENCNVSALPYHYVIKQVESEVPTANSENTGYLHLPGGTVFEARALSEQNECNNSNMAGGADAITICLTLPAGSWLTAGYNTETATSLKLLLRYLLGELGLSTSHIHNLKNEYIGDYPVNPDSWSSLIIQMEEDMRQSNEKFTSSEEDGMTVLTIPEAMGANSNLEWIAKYCCPNSSSSARKKFKEAVAEVNPDLWPNYSGTEEEDNKYIPYGTKINLPSGSIAAKVKDDLMAQGILVKAESGRVVAGATAILKENDVKSRLEEWNDPADVHHEGDDNIYLQNRGGKSEMKWRYQQMELPGYHNALLHFTKRNSDEPPVMLNFLISPSSVRENRATIVNNVKTLGGWVGQRAGQSTINISFAGYMLDIYEQLERHRFLADYKTYIESQKDTSHSYYNEYNCKLIIEGRDYFGYVSGLSFSKEAEKPYIYQYNINFTAYSDKEIYDPNQALVPSYKAQRNKSAASGVASNINNDNLYYKLLQLVEEGWAGDESTAAYKYLDSIIDAHTMGNVETVRAETQEWLNVLKYIKSKNNVWSASIRHLIDTSVISNLDIWGYENSEPDVASVVALFDKMCPANNDYDNPTAKTEHTNKDNHWSQPHTVSLYAKRIIRDFDEWFNSDWTVKHSDEKMSRGVFLALCDNINGEKDGCLVDENALDVYIMEELKKASGLKHLNMHWSYRHVLSLYKKGVISEPIDEYWLKDGEATITSEYALPLICKSKEIADSRVYAEYSSKTWKPN